MLPTCEAFCSVTGSMCHSSLVTRGGGGGDHYVHPWRAPPPWGLKMPFTGIVKIIIIIIIIKGGLQQESVCCSMRKCATNCHVNAMSE